MQCPEDPALQMFVEGELDPAAAEIVRAHMLGCARCRASVAQYKQLLWDLEHPADAPLPPELTAMQERLMAAWADDQRAAKQPSPSRSFIPAWAGYSVMWTRHMPSVDRLGRYLSRTGQRILESRLPFVRSLLKWRR